MFADHMKELAKCIKKVILNNLIEVPQNTGLIEGIEGTAFAQIENRLNEILPNVAYDQSRISTNGQAEVHSLLYAMPAAAHGVAEPSMMIPYVMHDVAAAPAERAGPINHVISGIGQWNANRAPRAADDLVTLALNAARRLLSANGLSDRRVTALLEGFREEFEFCIVNFRNRRRFVALAGHLASQDLHAIATLEARPGMPKRYFTITKIHHAKLITETDDIINPETYKVIDGARYTCTGITAVLPARKPFVKTALVDLGGDGELFDSTGEGEIISCENFIQRYNTNTLSIVRRTPRSLWVSDLTRTHSTINTDMRPFRVPSHETQALVRRLERLDLQRTNSRESNASTRSLVHLMDTMDISSSPRTRSRSRKSPDKTKKH